MDTNVPVMDGPVPEAPCRPNITAPGRRRRTIFGFQMLSLTIAALGTFQLLHAPWYWRVLLFFPAAAAATGFLQVRRDTCVLRARQGTVEHDDGSTSPAPDADVRASRAVARTIQRDAVLIGLAVTALGVWLAL